jgi:hypothetical protein
MRRIISVPVTLAGVAGAVVTVDALASVKKVARRLVGIVFDQVATAFGRVVFNQETVVDVISTVMGTYGVPIIPCDIALTPDDSLYVGYNDVPGTTAVEQVTLLFDEP